MSIPVTRTSTSAGGRNFPPQPPPSNRCEDHDREFTHVCTCNDLKPLCIECMEDVQHEGSGHDPIVMKERVRCIHGVLFTNNRELKAELKQNKQMLTHPMVVQMLASQAAADASVSWMSIVNCFHNLHCRRFTIISMFLKLCL